MKPLVVAAHMTLQLPSPPPLFPTPSTVDPATSCCHHFAIGMFTACRAPSGMILLGVLSALSSPGRSSSLHLCFLPQVEWSREALTQKKAGYPCSGLNAGSCFISQDEGMTVSPVETLEKAIVLHLFWTEGLTSFDTSKGALSSLIQKVTMPDSSGKLIGTPILRG